MAGNGDLERGAPPAKGRDTRAYGMEHSERQWTSWLVPMIVVSNIAMFVIIMFVNNCPKNHDAGGCVAGFLGRLSFQPLRENPLFGPSSSTQKEEMVQMFVIQTLNPDTQRVL